MTYIFVELLLILYCDGLLREFNRSVFLVSCHSFDSCSAFAFASASYAFLTSSALGAADTSALWLAAFSSSLMITCPYVIKRFSLRLPFKDSMSPLIEELMRNIFYLIYFYNP
jgi:hypothetical protein